MFIKLLKNQNRDRNIEFIQSSLRSALDIVKYGGHVTKKYKDQKFRLLYDNRREIIDDMTSLKYIKNINDVVNQSNSINVNPNSNSNSNSKNDLLKSNEDNNIIIDNLFNDNDKEISILNKDVYSLKDSKPLKNSVTCFNIRSIANKFRFNEYNQRTSFNSNKKYKNYKDIAVKSFIKGILSSPSKYPDISFVLVSYDKIIEFVKAFDPKYKISKSSLSHLKNRKLVNKQVPKNDDTILFVEYVKSKYPNFDEKLFFTN